jgi:threonine dehydratase
VPPTSLDQIHAARARIADAIHRTPTFSASSLGAAPGLRLFLKAELFQKTGSFKVRGVLNTIRQLAPAEIARGFVAFSAGNHGAALAWAARQVGSTATVVMPAHAVPSKVQKVRAYGGEPVLTDAPLMDEARRLESERGLTLVHPFDDPAMIAGHASAGLEILEDVPDLDAVVVPVGGGGIISGIAAAIKQTRPGVRVIGVEPTGADTMARSLASGRPERIARPLSVADGLCSPFAGEHTFAHVRAFVDQVVVIDDDTILRGLRALLDRAKLAAEPAGAAGVAAVLAGAVTFPAGSRVVCFVSGGNADPAALRRALELPD